LKKKICVVSLLLLLCLVPTLVLAGICYNSTLYISAGSNVTGASRNYTFKGHAINIRVDQVLDSSLTKKIVIMLGTSNWQGFTLQSRVVANTPLNSNNRSVMGNVGTGSKVYQFATYTNAGTGTGGTGTYYAGIKSNLVVIENY